MERKLASVKRITNIKPIDKADSIECAIVGGGWPVVIRKGEFKVNDLAVYLEIDSWVPNKLAPFLSQNKEPREFNGIKGERLRTIKLRGQLSQGLLLPLTVAIQDSVDGNDYPFIEGSDITDLLNIQKWEKPIPTQLRGQIRGCFPSFIHKTDQERIQNLDGMICWDDEYEITVKLDGSSMTVWFHNSDWGVCSRNLDLKTDQEGNTFVDTAKRIFYKPLLNENIAIQGELMGPGIQGNRENLSEHKFYVFDIWDISTQMYWEPHRVRSYCALRKLDHVLVVNEGCTLREFGIDSIATALYQAEGPSINHTIREGLVFKKTDGSNSFKAISNIFLLKE